MSRSLAFAAAVSSAAITGALTTRPMGFAQAPRMAAGLPRAEDLELIQVWANGTHHWGLWQSEQRSQSYIVFRKAEHSYRQLRSVESFQNGHVAKRIISSECVGSLLVIVKQLQTSVQFIYAYINKCMKIVYACIDLLINIYMHSPHPNAPELNVWLVGFFNHRWFWLGKSLEISRILNCIHEQKN